MRRGLLTLVVLVGCRDKTPEPPPPPPPHDGVTLIQAGSPPFQTLRYHLAKGTRTASELMYDVDMKSDGQGGPMPTLVVDFETAVEDVLGDGTARLRITVVGASVRDRPGSQPSDAMRSQAATLRGVVITQTLAPDGAVSGARVETAGASNQASSQLDALLHSLDRVAMRLPIEPVGSGATWRERRTLPEGGIRAISEIVYTLESITGSRFMYRSSGQSTGGPQTIEQEGMKVEVTDTHGQSSVHGSVDLSRYAVETTAASTFATTMTIAADAGAGAGRSTVEITMAVKMAPAPAGGGSDPAEPATSAPSDASVPGDAPALPSNPPAAPGNPPAPPEEPARRTGSAKPAGVDEPADHGAHSAP